MRSFAFIVLMCQYTGHENGFHEHAHKLVLNLFFQGQKNLLSISLLAPVFLYHIHLRYGTKKREKRISRRHRVICQQFSWLSNWLSKCLVTAEEAPPPAGTACLLLLLPEIYQSRQNSGRRPTHMGGSANRNLSVSPLLSLVLSFSLFLFYNSPQVKRRFKG